MITDLLIDCLQQSHLSFAELERKTGIKRQSLMRFVRRQQTIRLDAADRLATFFQLQLSIGNFPHDA